MVFLYQFSIYGHTQTKEEEEKKQVSGVENKVERKNRIKVTIKVAER